MSKRVAISEGSILWLELLSFGPPLLAVVLISLGHLNPVLLLISFVLCAGINLYSMITTGWGADNWSRAKYQRDGIRSSLYWLRFIFFSLFGIFSLIGLVVLLVQHAA
jgi:hypothetical protein